MLTEQINKVKTYIGFSIKGNKIIWGYDNILKSKRLKLVIVCSAINEKVLNKLVKHLKDNILIVQLKNEVLLEQITLRNNTKTIGIIDENLSKAILENIKLFNTIKRGN